jgi:hypothetical protein
LPKNHRKIKYDGWIGFEGDNPELDQDQENEEEQHEDEEGEEGDIDGASDDTEQENNFFYASFKTWKSLAKLGQLVLLMLINMNQIVKKQIFNS